MAESTYTDDEVIATIKWTVADVKSALEQNEINPTDENVKKVLDSTNRFQRTLEQRSIEEGWIIINDMVYPMFN